MVLTATSRRGERSRQGHMGWTVNPNVNLIAHDELRGSLGVVGSVGLILHIWCPLHVCTDPEKQNDCAKYVRTYLSLDQLEKRFVVDEDLLIVKTSYGLHSFPSTITNG